MTEDFKLSYTVKDVMRRTSLSHATIYRAIGDGRLKAVKCGKRTLVSVDQSPPRSRLEAAHA